MTQPQTAAPTGGQVALPDCGSDVRAQMTELDIDRLAAGYNPRTVSDETELRALADSLRRHGVLQPIRVHDNSDGTYTIIAGQRRYEAARLAGLRTIPAVIRHREATPAQMLAESVVENVVRQDMAATDEAHAIAELMARRGLSEAQVAAELSRSQTTIRQRLELLALPDTVKQLVASGQLRQREALTLARIAHTSPPVAAAIAHRVIAGVQHRGELCNDPAIAIRNLADEATQPDGVFCLPFTGGLDVHDLLDVAERIQQTTSARPDTIKPRELEHTAAQVAEIRALLANRQATGRLVEVSEADSDRAFAARVTIAYHGERDHDRRRHVDARFLVDAVWAADWALHQARTLNQTAVEAPAAGQPSLPCAADLGDPAALRERQRQERLAARADNQTLGAAIHQLDYQEQVSLEQATVLAALIVDQHAAALANALRVTRQDWLATELRTMSNGEIRSTEKLIDPADARQRLDELLAGATTGPQLLGRLFGALLGAVFCDQNALPAAQRRPFDLPYTHGREHTVIGAAPHALWKAAEPVLPDRIAARHKPTFTAEAGERPARDRLARS